MSPRLENARKSSPFSRPRLLSSWARRLSPKTTKLLFVIKVKAAARLASQISSHHHPLLNRTGPKPRILEERSVERIGGRKIDVMPDQVHQLKRTHAKIARLSHDPVDRFNRGAPVTQDSQGLVVKGTGNAIDDETRGIF